MSASEALCLLRNVGVLIGDLIPLEHEHWGLVILLRDIPDMVTSLVVNETLSYLLESIVHEYLNLLNTLSPNFLKPKHHNLIHYPTMMKRMGLLWNIPTMRCESKNRDFKITSHVAPSRRNNCETLAIKSQLRFNYRIRKNARADDYFDLGIGSSKSELVQNIPKSHRFFHFVPCN